MMGAWAVLVRRLLQASCLLYMSDSHWQSLRLHAYLKHHSLYGNLSQSVAVATRSRTLCNAVGEFSCVTR
jgi:hypothetical protein